MDSGFIVVKCMGGLVCSRGCLKRAREPIRGWRWEGGQIMLVGGGRVDYKAAGWVWGFIQKKRTLLISTMQNMRYYHNI